MHFRSLSLSVNETRSLSYTQADVEIPTIQSAADLYKKMFLQGDRKAMNSMIDRASEHTILLPQISVDYQ